MYGHINSQLDKVVNEANAELQDLQNKILDGNFQAVRRLYILVKFKTGLTINSRSLHEKNNELTEMHHDKSKQHVLAQYLYDTLKKRTLMPQAKTAVPDNMAQTLKTMANDTRLGRFNNIGFAPLGGRSIDAAHERYSELIPVNENDIEQLHRCERKGNGSCTREDMTSVPPSDDIPYAHRVQSMTPLHRTQLPEVRPAASRSQIPMSTACPVIVSENRLPRSTLRRSLGSSHVSHNSLGSASGFGFTAGMKVGHFPDAQMNGIDPHERPHTNRHR